MTYNYHCASCDHDFEKNISIEERDAPSKKPCPSCKKRGKVERVFKAPGISYEGATSDIRRAGSGWNDVLGRIHKYAGKRSQVDLY
jgi:putative FmdB family regulatory protein